MVRHRPDRVGHLIQIELSQIFLRKMKDPRIGFVTITHVGMSADLRSAKVFYSILGDDKAKADTRIGLQKATGFIQKEIADALKLRYTPKLTFAYDDSFEQGLKIEKVLHELKKDERKPAS